MVLGGRSTSLKVWIRVETTRAPPRREIFWFGPAWRPFARQSLNERGNGIMRSMKCVCIYHYGGPEVLSFTEAPRPRCGPGEVLVQVHAAGVNPVDWKIREGHLKGML